MTNLQDYIKDYYDLMIKHNWSYTKAAKKFKTDYPQIAITIRTLRKKFSDLDKNNISLRSGNLDKTTVVEKENNRELTYVGERSLTSKEDAVKFFKINLDKEEIYQSVFNSWDVVMKDKDGKPIKRTNYQVKLFVRPKKKAITKKDIDTIIASYDYEKYKNFTNNATGIGVACITDLHIGASTDTSKGLINTPDFNLQVVIDSLVKIAHDINVQDKEEVHVVILGDLIESFLGNNHSNSWQELELYGGNALIATVKILSKFLHSISNIKKVYMVTGNHDRSSSDRDLDRLGNVSQIVSYMLSKEFDIVFKPMVVSALIDNISYVFTHGHFGISKQSLAKIILDYGNQNYYNVVCQGHLHSRQSKKEYYKQDYTHMDSVNYRGITVAPVFTGNFYSESNGWTSSGGYSFITANHNKSNINHLDVSI